MVSVPRGHDDTDSKRPATERAAFDFLYGLTAGEFIAARNQLAKSLRAAGEKDQATMVGSLRRPSVLAAALNRVIRLAPAELDELIERAMILRDGHRRQLADDGDTGGADGAGDDVGALGVAHRAAAAALAEQAERNEEEIRAVLESASLDESMHASLRAAAFSELPTPTQGFDLFGAEGLASARVATVTSLSEARAKRLAKTGGVRPDSAGTTDDQPDGAEAQAEAERMVLVERHERARELHEQAGNAMALAERRFEAAVKGQDKAQERVDELAARLADAGDHLDDSQARVAAAVTARQRAEATLEAATEELDAAALDATALDTGDEA